MIIRPAKHLYKCVTGIAVGILLVSSLLAPTAANAAPTSHTVTPCLLYTSPSPRD